MGIEHDAAAKRVWGRDLADDDAVPGGGDERLLEPRLPETAA
jgi:hypothetical protein